MASLDPKEHDIEKLGTRCSKLHEALRAVFPMDTPEASERFELLEAAYVDTRYSSKYRIAPEDLHVLASHVRDLPRFAGDATTVERLSPSLYISPGGVRGVRARCA